MSDSPSKEQILDLIQEYAFANHNSFSLKDFYSTKDFDSHTTIVPYAGRVFGPEEVAAASSAILDFWLTLGKNGVLFEKKFSEYIGSTHSVLTNSGSSANLLAISALTSHKLGDRRLLPGDEVITVAAGFPTTVAPIIQNRLVPVFADNNPLTLNINVSDLEELLSERTKAIFIAHTLGNPFNLFKVKQFCDNYNLYLIEDNCDSLGSLYNNNLTGTSGIFSTQSFYPPHHMTLGEGGMVNINSDSTYKRLIESFRDWGRDCWCPSGIDNSCGNRYNQQFGQLPHGYDHKFTYSHFGYNLKPLDLQAAIGIVQLKKLDIFSDCRKRNWKYLRKSLHQFSDHFYFALPTHSTDWDQEKGDYIFDPQSPQVEPSWFGFMIGVKDNCKFTKQELSQFLDSRRIHNRMLFGGNILRQPVILQELAKNPGSIRMKKSMDYSGADKIMNSSLFVGTYPGLRKVHLDYICDTIKDFLNEHD